MDLITGAFSQTAEASDNSEARWPYSHVHFSAHLSLYLSVVQPDPAKLRLLANEINVHVYQSPVWTLRSLYNSFLTAWKSIQSTRSYANYASYFAVAIQDKMPGYIIPTTVLTIPVGETTVNADLRYSVSDLRMLYKAYADVYFLPVFPSDPGYVDITSMFVHEHALEGYVEMASRNIQEIQLELMALFGLTTMQIYYKGQILQEGLPMQQNRRLFHDGIITGLHKDFDRRYQITFYIKEMMTGAVRAHLANAIIPDWHYRTLALLPQTIKHSTRIRLYPRHTSYAVEIVAKVFTPTILAFFKIPGAQLDKNLRAIVAPIGSEDTDTMMTIYYDSQGIIITSSSDDTSPESRLALNAVLYFHLIPKANVPKYFDELVVVTGYSYPIELVSLRSSEQKLVNYASSVELTYKKGANRFHINKRLITKEDDLFIKLGITIMPDRNHGYVFVTADGLRRAGVSQIICHMHRVFGTKTPTTVTRQYLSEGGVINTSGEATSSMSSAPLHGTYMSLAIRETSLGPSHKMVASNSATLYVKAQQNQRDLVGGALPANVVYSPRFGKLVMLIRRDENVDDENIYTRRMAYNAHIPPGSRFGVGIKKAPIATVEQDQWYNYIQTTHLSEVKNVERSILPPHVDYYFAMVFLAGQPFFYVVNLALRKDDVLASLPITLQTNHHVQGALKVPIIKSVGKVLSKAPVQYPVVPGEYAGPPKKEFRFPRSGKSATVRYAHTVMSTYSPPRHLSGIHAALMHTAKWSNYAMLWNDVWRDKSTTFFAQALIDKMGMTNPLAFEMWFMRDFGATMYAPFSLTTGHYYPGEITERFLDMVDMMEIRTGLDIYVIVLSKKNTGSSLPKEAPMGVLRTSWAVVERRAKGRLWERTGRRVYIAAMMPLTHAHPRGDAYNVAVVPQKGKEGIDAAVSRIPVRPRIPNGTALVVMDNAGIPIAALTADLGVIMHGPMSLPRNVMMEHWTNATTLVPRARVVASHIFSYTGASVVPAMFSALRDAPLGTVYYAHQSETIIIGRIYLSMYYRDHYAKLARNLLISMTGYAPIGVRAGHNIPARIPRYANYAGNKPARKKYYENSGVIFADTPTPSSDTRDYPEFLPMMSTMFRYDNPDRGLFNYYFDT